MTDSTEYSEDKMASEMEKTTDTVCCNEHNHTDLSLASDADTSNVERLLMNLMKQQDEKFNNIQKSFSGLEDRVCKRLDQEKDYMRDQLADAMKLILLRLPDGTAKTGNAASQQSRENLKEQCHHSKESAATMETSESEGNQNIKSLLQTHGKTLLTGIIHQLTSGFASLKEETVQTLEKEKQELLTEKDFFREQLYKALADVLVHVQEIKTCLGQDRDDISLNFDLDKTDITLDDVKSAVDTSKEETAQELAKLKDFLVQELQCQTRIYDILAKFETSEKSVVKELHSGVKQLKETVQKTEDNIKQEMSNLEKNTLATIERLGTGLTTDLNKTRDEIVTEVKKTERNLQHVVVKESQGIETSNKAVIMDFGGDIQKMIAKESSEFKTGLRESQNTTKTELAKQRETIVRDVHVDMDKRMQAVKRNIYNVIEKECQLTREYNRWAGGVRGQETYTFDFPLTEYRERVGTGLKVPSCPWHIPQFDTCLRGCVRFQTNGTLSIFLINGRYTKVVGLRPKPIKAYSYRVVITDCDQGKEKVVQEVCNGVLDEITQKPWIEGYESQQVSCEVLENEGFVIGDVLLIKFTITVK